MYFKFIPGASARIDQINLPDEPHNTPRIDGIPEYTNSELDSNSDRDMNKSYYDENLSTLSTTALVN